MKRLAVLLVVSTLALSGCATSTRSTTQKQLPDVTLSSFTGGSSLDLAKIKGPAVVNVWASWCAPCRRELPHYQAFAAAHTGSVKVLGIDFQDTRKDRAQQLIKDTGVRYPLYADPDGRLRSRVLPQVILVDAHGKVVHEEYVEITSVKQLDQLVKTHLGVSS